jgi:bacterioferritin
LEPMTKVSDKLKESLNQAIAREIQVSIQYMWQHVQVVGSRALPFKISFRARPSLR